MTEQHAPLTAADLARIERLAERADTQPHDSPLVVAYRIGTDPKVILPLVRALRAILAALGEEEPGKAVERAKHLVQVERQARSLAVTGVAWRDAPGKVTARAADRAELALRRLVLPEVAACDTLARIGEEARSCP